MNHCAYDAQQSLSNVFILFSFMVAKFIIDDELWPIHTLTTTLRLSLNLTRFELLKDPIEFTCDKEFNQPSCKILALVQVNM